VAIVVMLVVGLFVSLIAWAVLPGKHPGGLVTTTALTVAGAIAVGLVVRELGWYAAGGTAGIAASVVGAVAALALYRVFEASPRSSVRSRRSPSIVSSRPAG
jgi:uncharacterized membrane protein YeaQ/YmgE (transglycosylase-associated protein family)